MAPSTLCTTEHWTRTHLTEIGSKLSRISEVLWRLGILFLLSPQQNSPIVLGQMESINWERQYDDDDTYVLSGSRSPQYKVYKMCLYVLYLHILIHTYIFIRERLYGWMGVVFTQSNTKIPTPLVMSKVQSSPALMPPPPSLFPIHLNPILGFCYLRLKHFNRRRPRRPLLMLTLHSPPRPVACPSYSKLNPCSHNPCMYLSRDKLTWKL